MPTCALTWHFHGSIGKRTQHHRLVQRSQPDGHWSLTSMHKRELGSARRPGIRPINAQGHGEHAIYRVATARAKVTPIAHFYNAGVVPSSIVIVRSMLWRPPPPFALVENVCQAFKWVVLYHGLISFITIWWDTPVVHGH